MPVTVTVSRGNPMPAPWAALLTVVGLALIVIGVKVGPIADTGPGFGDTITTVILWTVALLLAVPAWLLLIAWTIRGALARRRFVGDASGEVPEPPSEHDPAVVAVLIGEGKPSGEAVAGTVLALADRDVIDVEEYGEQIVIRIPPDARGADQGEQLVIDALRGNAGPGGDVVGPPVWKGKARWWPKFSRDARRRAAAAGLAQPVIPYVGLTLVLILTAVALSLVLFDYVFVFVGLILFANGLPHLIAPVTGYRLTLPGLALRARWLAFARYLDAQGSVRDVGPAGVVIWGPNLAYGAVLGAAERAARLLTPEELERTGPVPDEPDTATVEL